MRDFILITELAIGTKVAGEVDFNRMLKAFARLGVIATVVTIVSACI